MGKGRWWYDHTYQAFKARIKGLKAIIEMENNEVLVQTYKEMMLKEIDEFVDKTDIEITQKELEKLAEDIFDEL